MMHPLDKYFSSAGSAISELRLLIEGAVVVYENEATALIQLANAHGNPDAAVAVDTIGEALYTLRTHIQALQREHTAEAFRQSEE